MPGIYSVTTAEKRAFLVPLAVSQMRRLWLVLHQSYQDRGTRLFHVELTGPPTRMWMRTRSSPFPARSPFGGYSTSPTASTRHSWPLAQLPPPPTMQHS
uniref:Uncharacterized protein n=1 Tax=Aegilops tauschii subsp. strangulata TaxID=200361 RepID=A0A453AKU5_AEGTS